MLTLPPRVRVFVSMAPFDMRGGAHRMAGTARRLGLEPLDGHFYVFVSRRRNLLAVLHFDGSGWCVLKKRLERGSFQLPDVEPGADRVAVDGRVLAAMLQGLDLRASRRGWYRRGGAADC